MSIKSDNVLDDWEAIDDTELNTKVTRLKQTSDTVKMAKAATSNSHLLNGNNKPFVLLSDDECLRMGPPEPTVKILKRPTSEKSDKQLNETKPKAPVKTLQQREQEYAEARLRILGSAKSEEDESVAITNKLESVSIDRDRGGGGGVGGSNPNHTNNSHYNRTTGKPQQNGINSNNHYSNHYNSPRQQPPVALSPASTASSSPSVRRNEDNVIRLPRGPDGSTGFLLKR